jgi:hypothetical protein
VVLPFKSREILAVNSFTAFPVHLTSAEVDSPPCQDRLLHHPGSRVRLSFAHVFVNVVNVIADVELVTGAVLNIDITSAYVALKKS